MDHRVKQKLIIALVAIIGVILITLGGLTYFKDFGYKKHVDKQAGFAVSFPNDWAYASKKEGVDLMIYTPIESDFDNFTENVTVVVQDISANPVGVAQYTEIALRQMRAIFGEQFEVVVSESTYIHRRLGHKYVFEGKEGFPIKMMMVWTVKGEKAYQINYTAQPDTFDYYINDVEKIINSFKILG